MHNRWLLLAALLASPALAAPRVIPASDLLIRQSTPVLSWRWRAPPELATQPALLNSLRSSALQEASKAQAAARRDAAGAKKAGVPFRPYETITDWSLAADTPRLLAVTSEIYSFTGGAHGNTGYSVKIWDKTAKRPLTFDQLFSDWPRARKLLEPAFCAELARMQLGGPPSGDMNACPKLAEQPVVPWAGLATTARQYRVLLGPYVAGSYAEGSYLVDNVWPDAVKPLVKPAYRADLFGD